MSLTPALFNDYKLLIGFVAIMAFLFLFLMPYGISENKRETAEFKELRCHEMIEFLLENEHHRLYPPFNKIKILTCELERLS